MRIFKVGTILFIVISIGQLLSVDFVFASSTDGIIDSTYKYAWGENVGWINFGCDNCDVHITDSGLSGYALGENIGWINLDNVTNDGAGNLSGYAWNENAGWIKFNPTNGGVVINSSGEFTGSALGENIGWIIFDCDYQVKTDWRPQSARPTTPSPVPYPGGSRRAYIPPAPPKEEEAPEIIEKILKGIKEISERAKEITKKISQVFKPKPSEEIKPPEIPVEELVPEETPLVFQGQWLLITYTLENKPLTKFTLAPLPKEIRELAKKFPELEETFEKVGITKITDVSKLKTVELTLPGLTEKLGLPTVEVQPGKFALPKGVPVVELSPEIKQQLPTEIVFAKTGGQLIDFDIALSVTEKGKPEQRISTISGKPLQLVVKPEKPVKSIKGYVVFKSKKKELGVKNQELSLDSLLASMVFASPSFAKEHNPIEVEERLVLMEFEYTDPDEDGIYTAEIQAPLVEGEYEIITVMDYEDPDLGMKEIRLITVIDPEGYVYEKDGNKETRIPGAIISLFWLNPEAKQYELWPAKEYQQENPQITDATGKYSFLVPEGSYYLKVEAPSYLIYDGKPFQVKEGSGVHVNIELKTKYWWLKVVDWKTILLIAVILLLLYNFYRDKIRTMKRSRVSEP